MSGRAFLDSNVLLYAQDKRSPGKRQIAQALAAELSESGNGVISTQVMQEYFVASTSKLGIGPLEAKALIQSMDAFEIVQVTPELVMAAIDCSILNRLSFWDALIIAAADAAGCTTLYSEDLNPGQVILGVKVVNPFPAEGKRRRS